MAFQPDREIEPTFFSRYECKYLADSWLVPEIRAFLRPFMRPDQFAAPRPDHRYPVCSLYLDSEDLRLYQQTVAGELQRFKLRVRTYDDRPTSPAYFEVKRKTNGVVAKRRARLDRGQARELLLGQRPPWLDELPGSVHKDIGYFLDHSDRTAARPVLRVRYEREAYESTAGDPLRVTLDSDLMHCVTFDDDLRHASGRWIGTPLAGTIVEIKFTERFPDWIQSFVRTFGLHQCAIPKYVLCMDHLLLEGRASTLALAGVTLPPRRA